jgi:predicted ATPase
VRLSRLVLGNFRILRSLDLPLRPLNVLIGVNGCRQFKAFLNTLLDLSGCPQIT